MKKNLLIAVSLVFAVAMFSNCKKPLGKCAEFFEKDCEVDSTYYSAVCGCNDKTYANETYADCAQVEYESGACPD
jgi:hypothetical protein